MIEFTPDTSEARKRFNQLAREAEKLKILQFILADMTVCELEGWDKLEYIRELVQMLNDLLK